MFEIPGPGPGLMTFLRLMTFLKTKDFFQKKSRSFRVESPSSKFLLSVARDSFKFRVMVMVRVRVRVYIWL